MYLISGNITSNVTGNLPVITGNGNIGNITSNFRTLVAEYVHAEHGVCVLSLTVDVK